MWVEWDWIASVMSLRCSMGRVPEDRSELKETAAEWEETRTTGTLNEGDRMKYGEIRWERMRERERESQALRLIFPPTLLSFSRWLSLLVLLLLFISPCSLSHFFLSLSLFLSPSFERLSLVPQTVPVSLRHYQSLSDSSLRTMEKTISGRWVRERGWERGRERETWLPQHIPGI